MPRAEHDGVRIYYEDFPARQEAPGWPGEEAEPPLVLAHGFGVDLTMWDWQLEPLSWRRRLLLWDARGHGQSGAPAADEAYTMPLLASDLGAVLDTAGVRRAIVGGMSFGGMIALQFAVEHPERTRALILSDSVPRGAQPPGNDSGEPPAHGPLLAMRNRPDLTSALAGLTMPVLVIYGEHDQRIAAGIPALAEALPRRRIVRLAGCSHGTSAQRPREWTDIVLGFMDDVDAGVPVHEEMTV
jgi:pimeloyl-ACP methyl ester carboxylesterase